MQALSNDLADPQRLATQSSAPACDAPGVRMSYGRDEEIFGEGEPARNVYIVLRGAVRTYRMLSDGRRQIVEFHLQGDVFGFDGEPNHSLTAEAIGDTTLQIMRRGAYLEAAAAGLVGAGDAWTTVLRKLHRAEAHVMLLTRQSACERLVAFLRDMSDQTHGDSIQLAMSRQDIADYLGLTIETVSRTFTQLREAGLIDLPTRRQVRVRDMAAMDRICA